MKNSLTQRELFILIAYDSPWAIESIESQTMAQPAEFIASSIEDTSALTEMISRLDIPASIAELASKKMINIAKRCLAEKSKQSEQKSN